MSSPLAYAVRNGDGHLMSDQLLSSLWHMQDFGKAILYQLGYLEMEMQRLCLYSSWPSDATWHYIFGLTHVPKKEFLIKISIHKDVNSEFKSQVPLHGIPKVQGPNCPRSFKSPRFLAMTKQLHERFSLSARHTFDRSDTHAKDQGQKSKIEITEVKTQLSCFRTVTQTPRFNWQMAMKRCTNLDMA